MARRNKGEERAIAADRVARLVTLALDATHDARADRADRYAELAWRLKTRYRLGKCAIDGSVCRGCHAFWVPGATVRVRIHDGRIVRTCLKCGAHRRRPLR